ncbi:ATP-binding protein [Lysinibacillus sp. SGAir0095]|uniref:ATP-binding protein n=1 Tax=Lysinibacillus sp. SGAir0095 TaxID=2070463 RepID=UPI0010CD15C3|nr:ATP-binding protein [Lysinibacillus sp. SGAir0095]QCR33720.1 ATP-binding protein [Lysinibacillus sp. SGAir0095]
MTISLEVGSVIEVRGTRVKVQVYKELNHSSFIYEGEVINNISVNSFIIIKKGLLKLVGKIDAEYIEDLINNKKSQEKDYRYNKGTISKLLEVQILGYLDKKFFNNGVKHLPMIGNLVYIPRREEILDIYAGNRTSGNNNNENTFSIGKSIHEDISVDFPVNSFFASHMGIFGNTGSGKSNTLTKLYFELFKTVGVSYIKRASSFHLIDFNGEYAHKGVFGLEQNEVSIVNLSTNEEHGEGRLKITSEYFYTPEVLSVLFSAKEQTQKPFIKRLLKRMENAEENGWGFKNYLPNLFAKSLVHSSKDVFQYIKEIIDYLSEDIQDEGHSSFLELINAIQWHTQNNYYFISGVGYFNTVEDIKHTYSFQTGFGYLVEWCSRIDTGIGWCDNFILNAKLQLVSDMLNRYAQFDHINPLIHRIESKVKELEQIIELTDQESIEEMPIMTIYSFRECSSDIKKVIPSLIAKMLFDTHKKETKQDNIEKTIHLIIDEAHNILSNQLMNEGKGWHSYRLELFEEMIKEGRKFGFFLTICSQRPFDISPTIISQVHNYFIHRLVNNKDLEMIDNTIPTLDRVSKAAIPTLASGTCIVSGTALSMPVFTQVEQVYGKEKRPNSDNIDLCKLWM